MLAVPTIATKAAPRAFLGKLEEGVSILRATGHAGPITKADAVAAAAAQAVPAPSHAEAVKAQPRDKRGRVKPHSTVSDRVTNGTRGTHGAEYLTARIARDAPAILERMKAGEFPSVRAAARAAGILKPLDPVRVAVRASRRGQCDPSGERFTEPPGLGWTVTYEANLYTGWQRLGRLVDATMPGATMAAREAKRDAVAIAAGPDSVCELGANRGNVMARHTLSANEATETLAALTRPRAERRPADPVRAIVRAFEKLTAEQRCAFAGQLIRYREETCRQ
jgi:hypothetical protein